VPGGNVVVIEALPATTGTEEPMFMPLSINCNVPGAKKVSANALRVSVVFAPAGESGVTLNRGGEGGLKMSALMGGPGIGPAGVGDDVGLGAVVV
jgi:hypothetical protein